MNLIDATEFTSPRYPQENQKYFPKTRSSKTHVDPRRGNLGKSKYQSGVFDDIVPTFSPSIKIPQSTRIQAHSVRRPTVRVHRNPTHSSSKIKPNSSHNSLSRATTRVNSNSSRSTSSRSIKRPDSPRITTPRSALSKPQPAPILSPKLPPKPASQHSPSVPLPQHQQSQPSQQVQPPPPQTKPSLPTTPNTPSKDESEQISTPVPPKPLTEVGDYLVLRDIGQGTYGVVKLAEHKKTKKQVAIKVILKSTIKNDRAQARVEQELRLLPLLHHPHIVKVYDVVEDDERYMIIMQHLVAGELFRYIVKHRRVNEREARYFFRQMVSALYYCHQNSIVHRDLKPENMLLDSKMQLHLIDFGFATLFKPDQTLSTFCGSPYYAAPEMVKGVEYVGPEVDVWSLGVTLYTMLSGKLPFNAYNLKSFQRKVTRGEYDIPIYFSRDVTDLIRRMLHTDRRKRISLEKIRCHPWTNIGYQDLPYCYLTLRPPVIRKPKMEHLMNLVKYGYPVEESQSVILADTRIAHPLVSLYHLMEEASQRHARSKKGTANATTIQVSSSRIRETSTNSDEEAESELEELDPNPKSPLSKKSINKHRMSLISSSTPHINLAAKLIEKADNNQRMEEIQEKQNNEPKQDEREINKVEEQTSTEVQNEQTHSPTSPSCPFKYLEPNLLLESPKMETLELGEEKGQCNAKRYSIDSVHDENFRGDIPLSQTPLSGAGRSFDSVSRRSMQQQKKHPIRPALIKLTTHIEPTPFDENVTPAKEGWFTGLFNVSATSTKNYRQIIQEIERVLGIYKIDYHQDVNGSNRFQCESKSYKIQFEVRICWKDSIKAFLVQFKNLKGSPWTHKKICYKLIQRMFI